MNESSTFNFKKNYKVRSSIFILFAKVFWLETILFVASSFLTYLMRSGGSAVIDSFVMYRISIYAINIVVVTYLLLAWYLKYYVVSPKGIYSSSGIIFRRTESLDTPAIRSIQVNQGMFGHIFGYGTLKLISPLIEKDFYMVKIPAPFKHSSLIENARLKEITNKNSGTIIPSM